MFNDTFNYIYSNLGLDTGNLKIFYDFNSYDAPTTNILSVPDGDSYYSGTVEGDFVSFTGTSSGSGFFNHNHIKINDSSGLFSPNATFIFSQEKINNEAGSIFSNYSGGSGFEIGINNANKLYFINNYYGQPEIKTLNNIPCAKNIYTVSLRSDSLELQRYLPHEQKFESETFPIDPIEWTDNPNWLLGSGEYGYKGYLDTFVYIKDSVNVTNLGQLCRSYIEDAYSIPAITGEFSGTITGYKNIYSGISGFLGYQTGITGNLIETGQFSFTSGEPLTGCVSESGTIFLPLGSMGYSGDDSYLNEFFYDSICLGISGYPSGYSGDGYLFTGSSGILYGQIGYCDVGQTFGITGFEQRSPTGYFTGTTALVGITGEISGVIGSGVTQSGIVGPNIVYTGTGASTGFSGVSHTSYFPNSYFYTENRQPNYFVESIELLSGQNVNKKAVATLSPQTNKITFALDNKYNSDELNVAFNGISLLTGTSNTTRNLYNQTIVSLSDDYFITGDMFLFVGMDVARSDEGIFDIKQTGENKRTSLKISSTADYDSAPFSEINIDGTQVFFNGIKLYSGVSYHGKGGEFQPTGALTGITGTYFTYPDYTGTVSTLTGQGLSGYFDLERTETFTPDAHVFYINGVRQDPSVFIEHSSGVDLLATGKQVFKRYFNEIYLTQKYDR